jgi:hypothetical protein
MHYNEGCPSDIIPIRPHGTNNTFFTQCCGVAICDYEGLCPKCKRPVVGDTGKDDAERRLLRWQNATRFWKK